MMSASSQDHQSWSHLREHSKIISYSDGIFTLDNANLDKLVGSLSTSFHPVAFMSVIGPAGSGKSFYTNLLIHYLQRDGAGGWMSKLSSVTSTALEIEPLVGFSYGNVKCPDNIVPDAVSGIYLWPQPFPVSNYNGKIIVWILHIHLNEGDRKDQTVVGMFNELLNLLSSKVVEIKWNNDGFTFLETRHKLKTTDGMPYHMLCKGIVQLCRTSQKPSKVILSEDSEAIEYLQKIIPDTLLPTLEGLDFVRVAHISDNEIPLHDQSGFLSLHTKMYDRLDDVIKLIGDYKYIHPKLDDDGRRLSVYETKTYANRCVQHMNRALMERSTRSLKAAFMSDSPSSSSPSHNQENNETNSSNIHPNIAEDLSRDNINSPLHESSSFGVYGEQNTSFVSTYDCNEVCKNEKELKTSASTNAKKVHALRKEKISDDCCEGQEHSPASQMVSASSTSCENGNEQEVSDVDEVPMEVDDNSAIDNAVMNVQEDDSEKRKQEMEAKRHFDEQCKKREAEEEKLKAKLEMEEKKRQEEEKKKAILAKIDKHVAELKVVIQAGMLSDLNKWLDHTLTPDTISYCGKIYEKQYQQAWNAIKSETKDLKQSSITKFSKLLQEKTDGTRRGFDKVQEYILSFHSSIQKKAATHGYFSEYRLKELVEDEFQKLRRTMEMGLLKNEGVLEYVCRGCNKLAQIYGDQNRAILTIEQMVLVSNWNLIKEEYNKEMSRILEIRYFSPIHLTNIHLHLVRKLSNILTVAFRFKSTETNPFFAGECERLLGHLNKEFQQHKIANRLKLEKVQRIVSKLFSSSKAIYDGTMDKALRDHSNGLPLHEFMNIHTAMLQKANDLLRTAISENVGEVEPAEVHLRTLQMHIDNAWPSLLEENRANLKKMEDKQQHLQQNQEKGNDTSNVNSCFNYSQSSTSLNRANNEVRSGGLIEDKKAEQKISLSPLIFHLSLNHVRVGIELDNTFVPLPPVPAVVGVTNEGEWVCGANEKMQEEATKVWLIRECRHPWCEKIEIGDNVHEITVEFLFGFLFQTLKQQVEETFNGDISKAIFIIPFWFTSSQRQQVKDAGTVAGFTETLLINENSAIAFRATNKCNQISDIVVISENSGHVDVTVYACDKPKENLKMRGHHAVYERKEKQRKHRPSMFSWDYWKSFSFGGEVSDSKGNAVHDAYKLAMKQADSWKMSKSDRSRPKHVVVSFESENWKDVLVRTAQGLTEKASFSCLPCDGVVEGMGVVSLNPVVFYKVVQDCISFTIYKRNPTASHLEKVVQDDNIVLPLNGLKLNISSDLVIYASNACFYQKGIDGEGAIGDLKLAASMEDGLVKLEVTNEGITQLYSVNAKSKYDYRTRNTGDKFILKSDQYTWTTPNLNSDQIGSYASLLEYFKDAKKASNVSSETEQAKQELIEKGQELTQRIENKEGKFRSDLGRNMVKAQITEALQLLNHPKITTTDIEKQMDLFQKLEAKYFPQQ